MSVQVTVTFTDAQADAIEDRMTALGASPATIQAWTEQAIAAQMEAYLPTDTAGTPYQTMVAAIQSARGTYQSARFTITATKL
jgi:pectin methylesterase-like acyl-CoA thioesterase